MRTRLASCCFRASQSLKSGGADALLSSSHSYFSINCLELVPPPTSGLRSYQPHALSELMCRVWPGEP